MVAFNKFQSFVEAVAHGVHDLETNVLKVALSNTSPTNTDTVFAPDTLHPPPAAANGYAPTQATQNSSGQTGGVYSLVLDKVTFTATAGGIGPFRYAILYDDGAANDELIGWYDYGSSITLNEGETLDVKFSGTDPGEALTLE